jgi:hypothetical protein
MGDEDIHEYGGADDARKYIGQFADTSNLNYLNAR